jgi:hypothetical protein
VKVLAQTFEISGKLRLESTKEPVMGAAMFFVREDSTLGGATISDEEGKFSVKIARGRYTLKIQHIFIDNYEEEIRIWSSQYIGTIDLKPRTTNLEQVEIKGQMSQGRAEGDTLSFNADAYKTNPNASTKDLVSKMPGVQEQDGQIVAQGERVQQVLVDGKNFFGMDPAAALTTLPAEVVDKIQIFDDKSEQSKASGVDDGTNIKSINIVTKVEMRNGQFGRVYGGYGTQDRYNVGGNINSFKNDRRISLVGHVNNINIQNFSSDDLLGAVGERTSRGGRGGWGPAARRPSFMSSFAAGSSQSDFMINASGGITNTQAIGINYQDNWGKKTEVSSSYLVNRGVNETFTNTLQDFFLAENQTRNYQEFDTAFSTNINHKFNAKIVHKLTERSSIFYLPSLSAQVNEGESVLLANNRIESQLLSSLAQMLTTDLMTFNISNNLMYRLNGEKRGRSFFVNIRHDYVNTLGDRGLMASDVISLDDDLLLNANLKKFGNTYTSGAMFSEPIGKKGAGLFVNYEYSRNEQNDNINSFRNNQSLIDSALSLNQNVVWNSHAIQTGIRKFNRDFGFIARLSYNVDALNHMQIVPEAHNNTKPFHTFQPFILVRKRFKNNATWRNVYRTYVITPEASQLNSQVINTNPAQQMAGNRDLGIQYGHWFMSRYNAANAKKSTIFYANLSGGFTNNYLGTNTVIARSDTSVFGANLAPGSQITIPVNLSGQYSINGFLNYAFPLRKLKSNFNFNSSGVVNQIPAMINDKVIETVNMSFGNGVVLSSNISEKIDFTISTDFNINSTQNNTTQISAIIFYTHLSKVKFDWILPKDFTFRTQFNYQRFYGLDESIQNRVMLLNAGVGKLFGKQKRGEILISVFDALNQNNNIMQQFEANFFQQTNRNVLNRYIMATLSYQIRKFKSAEQE